MTTLLKRRRNCSHYYFVFKPGDYDITWEIVVDGAPVDSFEASLVQWIQVSDNCKGCLGCTATVPVCRERFVPERSGRPEESSE